MNTWEDMQTLFEAAVDLSEEERSMFLRDRVGDRPDLLRAIQELIEADRAPAGALDRGALPLFTQREGEPDPEALCGQTFGPYRIEGFLASGGMAQVYRASRTTVDTTRRVAIKVLRPGLKTTGLLDRFQRERQTLARLEHENIVSFLDGGTLPDGRPFLAMEFVEGIPLTSWSRHENPTTRERIQIFLRILAAVQYAHQNLIVHRDLKPANVLVTGSGIPKLLDFGIATVLRGDEDPSGWESDPFTYAYASPEQIRGEVITTASDVFSLGALLYELLTGRLAMDDRDRVGHQRGIHDGRARSPGMDRDLRDIVDKAVSPDPACRYPSAESFADDLRRYLAGNPVIAHPATAGYRLRKFLGRNRWPVALATAFTLALLTGFVGAEIGRRRARQEASMGWGAHRHARWVAHTYEGILINTMTEDPVGRVRLIADLEAELDGENRATGEGEALVRLTLARLYLLHDDVVAARRNLDRVLHLAATTRGLSGHDSRKAQDLLVEIEAR